MKWSVVFLCLFGVAAGLCLLAMAFLGEDWNGFQNYGNGHVAVEERDEQGGSFEDDSGSVSYSPKFVDAQELLADHDIENTGDYLIVVDISEQKEYVFSSEGGLEAIYTVSTGSTEAFIGVESDELNEGYRGEDDEVDGYEDRSMTKSIWKVVKKITREENEDLDAIYGERMLTMDLLVGNAWVATDVALHGTDQVETLGTPASLGCVYHKNADIIDLYEIVAVGTFVVALP